MLFLLSSGVGTGDVTQCPAAKKVQVPNCPFASTRLEKYWVRGGNETGLGNETTLPPTPKGGRRARPPPPPPSPPCLCQLFGWGRSGVMAPRHPAPRLGDGGARGGPGLASLSPGDHKWSRPVMVHSWGPVASGDARGAGGRWLGKEMRGRCSALASSAACSPSACHRYRRARRMPGTSRCSRWELFFCHTSYLEYLACEGFWKLSWRGEEQRQRQCEEHGRPCP